MYFCSRYEYTPPKDVLEAESRKQRWVPRYQRDTEEHHREKRAAFDPKAHDRMMDIIRHKESINAENCNDFTAEELQLEGKEQN